MEILSVKKEANLPERGTDKEEVGNGDVDLRWSSLLMVCQRRRGGDKVGIEFLFSNED